MFDYLQQFNKLPKELREKVSSPAVMDVLLSLEKKYNLNLAMLVMQIMIKQLLFKDLPAYLVANMGLSPNQAEFLSKELKEKIFFSVATYLGLKEETKNNPQELELAQIIKDSGIILPSQDLLARCRYILLTYRKGIRTKIDAKAALEKTVSQGGLGLDPAAADRLLKAVDRPQVDLKVKETEAPSKPLTQDVPAKAVVPAIDNLIKQQEAATAYDLKKNLAQGLKVPPVLADKFKSSQPVLDPSHELEAPEEELALSAPPQRLALEEGSSQKTDLTKKIEKFYPATTPQEKSNVQAIEKIEQTQKTDKPLLEEIKTSKHEPTQVIDRTETKIESKELPQVVPTIKPQEAIRTASFDEKIATEKRELQADTNSPVVSKVTNVPSANLHFKKDEAPKNVFSRFFANKLKKDEKDQDQHVKIGFDTNHLEEMVKAASLRSGPKLRQASASNNRPKMDDVKLKPKVMGPLEELRYLDLANFRRLGDSPSEITKKIISKIKLLERDGYDRMVQGVQAWRQSPVNKTYVRLMQEAINKGLTLSALLEVRQTEKKEALTKEEIEAIVDMNSKLMF